MDLGEAGPGHSALSATIQERLCEDVRSLQIIMFEAPMKLETARGGASADITFT